MKDTIQCRFDPPDFFKPGTKVWVVHCRSRAIQEGEVLAVRFEMRGTDPDGAISLGFTGYRLNLYYRNRSDAHFPLHAVYGARQEAELVKEYRETMRLSPIDKRRANKQNWPAFNERRLFLIDKEHHGGGLAPEETQELECLQELAGVRRGRHDWGMHFHQARILGKLKS